MAMQKSLMRSVHDSATFNGFEWQVSSEQSVRLSGDHPANNASDIALSTLF
jgi:hypothetical protein